MLKKVIQEDVHQKYKNEILELKKQINKAHQDIQEQIEECKKKELDIENLEDFKRKYFESIENSYNSLKKTNDKLDQNFELKLSLNDSQSYELLERMKHMELPNMKKIT